MYIYIYINTTHSEIHVGYSSAGASVVGASVAGAAAVGASVVDASVRGQRENYIMFLDLFHLYKIVCICIIIYI